jgi:enterochelin esterase family protein
MRQINRDLWAVTLALPPRSRIEYKVAAVTGGHEELRPDPLNPRTASDPFGFNSVVNGPGYAVPEWVDPTAPHGSLYTSRVRSPSFHAIREVTTYLPIGYPEAAPYPLVVVHDGGDFRRHADLVASLDGLISRRLIPPLIAVMTDPVNRLDEYGDDPGHADHVDAVIRHVSRRHRVATDPRRWILLGASLGGVASLSTAMRLGHDFGGLVLLSGSFVTARDDQKGRGAQFDRIVEFTRRVLEAPGSVPKRIAMACGAYENLAVDNRMMAEALGHHSEVIYEEAPDGHHWHNWRDRLGKALAHVLA